MRAQSYLSTAVICLVLSNMAYAQPNPTKPNSASNTSRTARQTIAPKANLLTPPASPDQINAAERTHFGDYACEFNQKIHVSLYAKQAGYIEVKHLNKVFIMTPVMSSTGALRLEDVRGQTLLLQIANKSMLMDVKAGKRIVDSCIHAAQDDFNKAARPSAMPMMN